MNNIIRCRETLSEHSFPVNTIIETVSGCNLSCVMCPQRTMRREHRKIDFGLWKKLIDECAEASTVWPSLMGEFMTLGECAIKMTEYAKAKNTRICINTNGICDSTVVREIVLLGVDEIYFSIDAISPETYDKIRVGGNINTVTENVHTALAFKNKHQNIYVQFIDVNENKHEKDAFIEHWKDYDVIVKIKPVLNWGSEDICGGETKEVSRFACPWLTRHALVISDGRMIQCDSDYEGTFSPGDVNKNSIESIWNGELKKRRNKHWNGNYDFEPCKNCTDWCVGRSCYYKNGKEIQQ